MWLLIKGQHWGTDRQNPTVAQTLRPLQSDRGAGSVEETLPWPGKMASPPEPRDAGDSAPAGFGLAPFGNQRAELASPCSQMSVEGKGDDVCVWRQKPVESLRESIMTYYHHNWSYPTEAWLFCSWMAASYFTDRNERLVVVATAPAVPNPGPIIRYTQ